MNWYDTEQNLTRTEVYFGHHKQLIYTSEKEISKELATVVVEKLCPDMTKLEMFARSSRVDWDCWGDQADLFDQLNAEIDNDTSLSA